MRDCSVHGVNLVISPRYYSYVKMFQVEVGKDVCLKRCRPDRNYQAINMKQSTGKAKENAIKPHTEKQTDSPSPETRNRQPGPPPCAVRMFAFKAVPYHEWPDRIHVT